MDKEDVLENLPSGFDCNVIVNCRDNRTIRGATLRLAKCDYGPIARNHFKGWFAFPDTISAGFNKRRHCLISRILRLNEGECVLECVSHGKVIERTKVKIINAFQDRNNVVVYIERK